MPDFVEVIAGPLSAWVAPVGTAFPAVNAAPGVAWTLVGSSGTANQDDDGVAVSHIHKIEVARPGGRTGAVKAWRTEEDFMIALKIWDLRLEMYTLALNGVAVTTVAAGAGTAGYKKLGLSMGTAVKEYALLVRGANLSPYLEAGHLQYEVPRVYQSDNPKPLFKKGKPAGLALEFSALEAANPASADEYFGRILGMTALPV